MGDAPHGVEGVWVGAFDRPWARFDGGTLAPLPKKHSVRSTNCGLRDSRGGAWLCDEDNLLHVMDGRIEPVPYPPEIGSLRDDSQWVQALAMDGEGALWLAGKSFKHIYRWHGGHWSTSGMPSPCASGVSALEQSTRA